MQGRPDRIEAGLEKVAAEIAGLATLVAGLTARVAALEKALPPPAVAVDAAGARIPAADTPPHAAGGGGAIDLVALLTPAGGACLALGGAYLLRALTETGRLPLKAGVALGFVYALAWFVAADRGAARRPVSGTFHGLAGVLIALPILWESTTRFGLLSAGCSALAAAVLGTTAFIVAWRRRLQVLAGVACVGTIGLALALAVASGRFVPYALLLVGASVGAWWLSDAADWPWLKWPPALASAIVVASLGLRAGIIPPPNSPAASLATSLCLVLATLLMVARRVLRGGAVRAFDAAQTLLALLAGLGAAYAVAPHLGGPAATMVGSITLALGALACGAAFALVRTRRGAAVNFHYYALLGLLLLIGATASLFTGPARDVAFTLLAIASAWWGARAVHPVFAVHAATFAVAAAVTSGMVACAAALWLARPSDWPLFPPTGALVLVAALSGGRIPRHAFSRALTIAASMSRLVLAVVLVATLGSLVVLQAGPLVAGTPPDPGRLASLETMVLSAAAVALALVARLPFGGELGWLAYPVLFAGGFKIFVEDLRVSTASMLFVSLALYGTALILTSRIRRRRPRS